MILRKLIDQILTTKSILKDNLSDKKNDRLTLFSSQQNHEEARALIQHAATITQERLALHISDLVSLALSNVFSDPYTFQAKFISKRGNTECELLLIDEKGNEFQPLQSCGYGAADIVSFALRIVIWSLSNNNNVLIYDEPFRFLSKDLMEKASQMVSEISKELEIQIIMVTHSEKLAGFADKTFTVKQENGISQVNKL